MQKKNILLAFLVVASTACLVFGMKSIIRLKKDEADFNKKKAILVIENLDLRDHRDSLQEITDKYAALEKEKVALESDIEVLKEENMRLKDSYDKLKLRNDFSVAEIKNLSERLASLETKRIFFTETIRPTENRHAESKIKENNAVALAPIVVQGTGGQSGGKPIILSEGDIIGEVVSVDVKNNLVIIDRGTREEIKNGDRCYIFKEQKTIAAGDIINVRYKESAVFIETVRCGNKIEDIKENYEVSVKKKE